MRAVVQCMAAPVFGRALAWSSRGTNPSVAGTV